MYRRLRSLLVLFVAAVFVVSGDDAHGGVIYETGFEPPAYSLGALPGQDGWFQDIGPAGIFDVQAATVFSGAHAAAFHSVAGLPTFTRAGHFAPHDTSTGDPIVQVEMQAFFSSTGDASWWRPFAAFSGTEAIGGLDVGADGQVSVFASTGFATGVFLSRDTWHRLALSLDFSTRLISASVNGSTVASGLSFAGSAIDPTFLAFTVEVIDSGTDTLFFDELTVRTTASVPLPSSSWLLLVGGSVLTMTHRRRR